MAQCTAITRNKNRCRCNTIEGEKFCGIHSHQGYYRIWYVELNLKPRTGGKTVLSTNHSSEQEAWDHLRKNWAKIIKPFRRRHMSTKELGTCPSDKRFVSASVCSKRFIKRK